jgi:hypothetical protein
MSDAKSPPDLSMDEILATIRRIIAEDEQVGAPSTGSPAGAAAQDNGGDSNDVVELTEAINEDGSTRHLAPIGSSARPATGMRAPSLAAPRPEPEPEPQRRETPNPRPVQGQTAAAIDERLVSEIASFAAAAAFARLATVRRAPREPAMVGDRTLEDIVGDLLRPLLHSWLDDNLPQIVERLVEAEITRVADRSGVA